MAEHRLSFFQRVARVLTSPRTFAAMEAHSRAWTAKCPDCAFERSIWALGGIRYKAAGKPRQLMRCPKCGQAGWHRIEKSGAA